MANRQEKLDELAELEGFDSAHELLEEYKLDSVTPGICMNKWCSYVTDVESDSDSGWCDNCAETSVESCIMLGFF